MPHAGVRPQPGDGARLRAVPPCAAAQAPVQDLHARALHRGHQGRAAPARAPRLLAHQHPHDVPPRAVAAGGRGDRELRRVPAALLAATGDCVERHVPAGGRRARRQRGHARRVRFLVQPGACDRASRRGGHALALLGRAHAAQFAARQGVHDAERVAHLLPVASQPGERPAQMVGGDRHAVQRSQPRVGHARVRVGPSAAGEARAGAARAVG
mmetsp:Transcript_28147/g.69456  ORF Transcript_28147/g.69456 Transcript_28147/m.69456 type:complete len:213 (+) Transcript_28147:584-1222(+)